MMNISLCDVSQVTGEAVQDDEDLPQGPDPDLEPEPGLEPGQELDQKDQTDQTGKDLELGNPSDQVIMGPPMVKGLRMIRKPLRRLKSIKR